MISVTKFSEMMRDLEKKLEKFQKTTVNHMAKRINEHKPLFKDRCNQTE
jgi:hypothetical protein